MPFFLSAAAGVGATFFLSICGAALAVILGRLRPSPAVGRIFSGFACGVMTAALVFSLLVPAIEMNGAPGVASVVPALGGFVLGGVFLLLLDLWPGGNEHRGLSPHHRLMLVVGLHNVPQGMAVALSCAMAAQGSSGALSLMSATTLAIGIGVQNIPENMALTLGLRAAGLPSRKSFFLAAATAFIEPLAGLLSVGVLGAAQSALPWFLGFAAGAMLYAVADDFMPCSAGGKHEGTAACLVGFGLMLLLDAALSA